MPGTPQDWNVVVNGAWNLAILTPSGIAKRLLQLAPGTPVEVHVAVEQPGVVRVMHGGSIVTPAAGRLFVEPSPFNLQTLQAAAVIAQRALQSLPETPVSAAGVNVKYRFDALPDSLLQLVASPLDDTLADAEHTIVGRHMRRTVKWQNGVLNIDIEEQDNVSGIVGFNFHCDSDDTQILRDWLGKVADMIPATDVLMTTMTAAVE